MGYQFVQTVAQLQQVHLSQQQLWQLAQVNQQLSQQQQAAAFQADLHQALFETENAAKRVAATIAQDPFAAAVLAHEWFPRIRGIEPHMFGDVSSKRAWSDANGTLGSAARRGDSDPALREFMHRYLGTMAEWQRLRAPLGQDPDWFVADARTRAQQAQAQADAKASSLKVVGAVTGGLLLLFIIAAAAGSGVAGLVFLLMVGGIVIGGFTLQSHSLLNKLAGAARGACANADRMFDSHARFMADPNHGGFLQKTWHEHPLLFNAPIPDPSLAASTTTGAPQVQTYVERQLVERQVVVTRCKFCKQLTPVDRPMCSHCGAPGFGS